MLLPGPDSRQAPRVEGWALSETGSDSGHMHVAWRSFSAPPPPPLHTKEQSGVPLITNPGQTWYTTGEFQRLLVPPEGISKCTRSNYNPRKSICNGHLLFVFEFCEIFSKSANPQRDFRIWLEVRLLFECWFVALSSTAVRGGRAKRCMCYMVAYLQIFKKLFWLAAIFLCKFFGILLF